MTFKDSMKGLHPKFNVVTRLWRVVYRLNSTFEPDTIKYTLEAESWNKAYLRASDEAERIAELLGCAESDVIIESVTGIAAAEM